MQFTSNLSFLIFSERRRVYLSFPIIKTLSLDLKNKIALITGAASGIGESTAVLFAKQGAGVLLTNIDTEKGKELTTNKGIWGSS